MTAALAVAVLAAGGTYLLFQRGLVRVVLGLVLLGHAANLLLVAAGGMGLREAPLVGEVDPAAAADPLPQAFALTAIVITFGITVYLLGMAGAGADAEPDRQDEPGADDVDAAEEAEPGAAPGTPPVPAADGAGERGPASGGPA
ncbi:sodium:proton antiporter [Trujillonella humicola]|uniref:sodium:proton antiporter n=1 Tax=Trujillonella humicola TaxID=3383699 RepID=UPI0039065CCA